MSGWVQKGKYDEIDISQTYNQKNIIIHLIVVAVTNNMLGQLMKQTNNI